MIMNKQNRLSESPPGETRECSDLDPAKLSSTLRELALRAHQLVRARDGSSSSRRRSGRSEQELTEVHAQIVRLQRNLGSHQLDDLATYVAALQRALWKNVWPEVRDTGHSCHAQRFCRRGSVQRSRLRTNRFRP